MLTVNNVSIILLQRIFNCDKIHDISITSDEVLNSLVYGLPLCVIIYIYIRVTYCQKWSEFSWLKLIGIFGAVWFLQIYAKNI